MPDPVWTLLHPSAGLELPFDWVVEFAPDGDLAAAVGRAWSASCDPRGMLHVIQEPARLAGAPRVEESRAGARAIIHEVIKRLLGRSARKHLYLENADTHSVEFAAWYRYGGVGDGGTGWVAQLSKAGYGVLRMIARLEDRQYPTLRLDGPMSRLVDLVPEDLHPRFAEIIREHMAPPDPVALGFPAS